MILRRVQPWKLKLLICGQSHKLGSALTCKRTTALFLPQQRSFTANMTTSTTPTTDHLTKVDQHYGRGNLLSKIEQGLNLSGTSTEDVQVDHLAPIDAFHSRGMEGTQDLIDMAKYILASDRVVDVGCGFGGTARHLANTFDCSVTGVDLTQEFVDVGQELTKMVGLEDKVQIIQGSAIEMPLQGQQYDIAWTEHVQMNIQDKVQFYSEIARVLKPGGCLLFHDVFRGTNPEALAYPVPWAEVESLSKLAPEDEIRSALDQAGLEIAEWQDKTEATVDFFRKALEKISKDGPPPLGIHLLMGSTAKAKIENHLSNLESGKTVVVMGMATKKSPQ